MSESAVIEISICKVCKDRMYPVDKEPRRPASSAGDRASRGLRSGSVSGRRSHDLSPSDRCTTEGRAPPSGSALFGGNLVAVTLLSRFLPVSARFAPFQGKPCPPRVSGENRYLARVSRTPPNHIMYVRRSRPEAGNVMVCREEDWTSRRIRRIR